MVFCDLSARRRCCVMPFAVSILERQYVSVEVEHKRRPKEYSAQEKDAVNEDKSSTIGAIPNVVLIS
jgi:hypothetical protein